MELELPDGVVATAAFHAGDVVCLRVTSDMSDEAHLRLGDHLKRFTQRTGVEFLILSKDVDVVVPLPEQPKPKRKKSEETP